MVIQIYAPPVSELALYEHKLGDINDAISLEYEMFFCGVGTFTLELPLTTPFAEQLYENNLLYLRDDDVCFIIKNVKHTSDKIIVVGYDLNGMLLDRLTMERDSGVAGTEGKDCISGTTEACVKHFINYNMIASPDIFRNYPRFAVADDLGRGNAQDSDLVGKEIVEDVVRTLCEGAGLGYRVKLRLHDSVTQPILVFDVYEREDHTADQSERNRVIFSEGLQNITEIERETGITAEKNALWCDTGGENMFVYKTFKNGEPFNPVGWDRREEYISLSVTNNYDTAEIEQTARKQMADKFATTDSLVIDAGNPLDYGTIYKLGDIVTVYDKKRSLQLNSVISSVLVKRSGAEHSVQISLGERKPKLLDKYAKQSQIQRKEQTDFPPTDSATYTTKQIFSTEETELSDIVSTPLNLDFTVDNADSDVIVTVNQYMSVSSGGTVQSAYVVDGEELFTASEDVSAGRHVLTHVVPVSLLAGQHNLIIRQLSADARGLTEAGGLRGAASGHISGITIELPPNDNLIIKVSIPEDGYELDLNSYGSSYAGTTGMIYWGDGSTQSDYNYTSAASHVYEKAGDYKIVITSTTVNMPSALINSSDQAVVTEIALPDNTTVVGGVVNGYTALRSISFGADTKKIDGTCGYCTSLSGTLKLPEKLEELAIRSFERCSALTKVIADCPSLKLVEGFIFDSCTSLTDVEWNAPVLGNLQFSDCTNLKNVSFGKGITVIPNQCFKNCASLNNVVIPEGVTTIIFNAFQGCASLDSVQLPSTLQEIGSVAFGGTALKSVSLPDGCTYYSNSFPSGCVVSGGVLIS